MSPADQETLRLDWAIQQIVFRLLDQPIERVIRACADLKRRRAEGEPLQCAIDAAVAACRAGELPSLDNVVSIDDWLTERRAQ